MHSFRMDSFKVIRVVAFFVAGVVVAVGAAFIYSTAQESSRAPEIPQSTAEMPQPVSPPISPLVIDPDSSPDTSRALAEAPVRRPNTAATRAQSSAPPPKSAIASIAKPHAPVLRLPRTRRSYEPETGDSAPILLVPARVISASNPSASSVSRSAGLGSFESARQTPPRTSNTYAPAQPQPRELRRTASPIPGRQAHVITLERGLMLSVRLSDKLSTDYNFSGETFHSSLEEPVIANGFIIADTRSTVFGRIDYAHKAHLLAGDSELTLTLTAISTTDGQIIAIETSPWREKGARTTVVNTAEMAVGAVAGAVVGALSGAARGAGLSSAIDDNSAAAKIKLAKPRSVTLLPGTELSFRLAMPVTIRERLNTR